MAYNFILQRDPLESDYEHFLTGLAEGKIRCIEVAQRLIATGEFISKIQFKEMCASIHQSRCRFVKSFPKAEKILDLGGGSVGNDEGALIAMGYPPTLSTV